jgi:hypothetical protein
MIYKTDAEVKSLVRAFEERTLSKAEWTHAAHLTVGLYYCLNCPFALAVNWMRDGIHWLNDAHGTPNSDTSGYHETLTIFWLLTIEEFVGKTKCGGLAETANLLIESCAGRQTAVSFLQPRAAFLSSRQNAIRRTGFAAAANRNRQAGFCSLTRFTEI